VVVGPVIRDEFAGMDAKGSRRNERGLSLVELVVAVVVIAILATAAIVGIGGLTATSRTSACNASADAARTASAVYYTNHSKIWPTRITQMTADAVPEYAAPSRARFSRSGKRMTVDTWSLRIRGGGTSQPTFACT
jgi:prepilin-type N-terminal cleavage/methylation domain-containing protein